MLTNSSIHYYDENDNEIRMSNQKTMSQCRKSTRNNVVDYSLSPDSSSSREQNEISCNESSKEDNILSDLSSDVPMAPPLPSAIMNYNYKKRKPDTNAPPVPLSRLYWNKIQFIQDRPECVWHTIRKSTINKEELFKLFTRRPSPASKSCTFILKSRKTRVKLLSAKKSQLLDILISSRHLTIDKIRSMLFQFSDAYFNDLRDIYKVWPSATEMNSLVSFDGDDDSLDFPEVFLRNILKIPHAFHRIACTNFVAVLKDNFSFVCQRLDEFKFCIEYLLFDEKVKTILSLILTCGNCLNAGTSFGNASGFSLDILPRLKDVKSYNGSISLLQFIVREYINVMGRDKLEMPFPEVFVREKACRYNLADFKSIMDKLKKDLLQAKDCLLKIEQSECEHDNFHFGMNNFISNFEELLRGLVAKFEETDLVFFNACALFCINVSNESSLLNPWFHFACDFNSAWKKEIA